MTERLDESIFGDGDVTDDRGRHQRRQYQRRRRLSRGRRWVVLVLALAIFAGGAYLAKGIVETALGKVFSSEEMDFPGPGEGSVKVVIKAGEDGEAIATTLKGAGVVKTRTAYLDVVRANADKAAAIQAGTYAMRKGMTAKDAFALLINPANRAGGVTIREGLWAQEIYPLLSKATGVPVAEYQKAARNPQALGLPAAAKGNVEGWLFPSTYEFPDKASATAQLRTMVAKAVAEMRKTGVSEADWERTMTLASLVEAEARLDVDRPKVARVFLNRIANTGRLPTMGLLQSDASISYGVKRRAAFPTDAELDDRANPYNLRFRVGLPPGPIDNPGAKAIEAAVHPATGPWLFFVAVNLVSGETKYATTLAEHDELTAELHAWCRANPGNGC